MDTLGLPEIKVEDELLDETEDSRMCEFRDESSDSMNLLVPNAAKGARNEEDETDNDDAPRSSDSQLNENKKAQQKKDIESNNSANKYRRHKKPAKRSEKVKRKTIAIEDPLVLTTDPAIRMLAVRVSAMETQLKELIRTVHDGFATIIQRLPPVGRSKKSKTNAPLENERFKSVQELSAAGGYEKAKTKASLENERFKIIKSVQELSTAVGYEKSKTNALMQNEGFKIIKSVQELQAFNEKLSKITYHDDAFNVLKFVCNDSTLTPYNLAYSLIDVIVERNVMRECSWKGGSKTPGVTKISFESLKHFRLIFLQLVRLVHPTFPVKQMNKFFMSILSNAKNRATNKRLRASRQKIRKRRQNNAAISKRYLEENNEDHCDDFLQLNYEHIDDGHNQKDVKNLMLYCESNDTYLESSTANL